MELRWSPKPSLLRCFSINRSYKNLLLFPFFSAICIRTGRRIIRTWTHCCSNLRTRRNTYKWRRNSTKCTVRWDPRFNCAKYAPSTIKTSKLNPAVISYANRVSNRGRWVITDSFFECGSYRAAELACWTESVGWCFPQLNVCVSQLL